LISEGTWEGNPDERLIGTRLGSYRLEAIAGYGGMGAVYRAYRDDDEYHQKVAIKLVRAAAESRYAQQRFRQERQILARLIHPNIACLLDGGSTPENVPYLVMEYIEGEPITDWCERRSLSVDDRVRIFLPVCDGVEAANREMVIHRDLKPANILVTRDGVPKLLDFGIAKLLDTEGIDREGIDPAFTATRSPMMTPEYAAPEQLGAGLVTAATDVYALGLVLYEVLTARKAQAMPDRTPHSMVRVICQTEPVRPASLNSQLTGDLDHIIRKAIRKEPERRYQSADDLGGDLRRYLAGLPVTARQDTIAYRSSKFLRRNRTAAKTGLVSAAIVCGAAVLTYWFGRPPRPSRVLQVEQLTHDGRIDVVGRIVTDGSKLYFDEQTGARTTLYEVSVDGGIPSPVKLSAELSNPRVMDISPDHTRLLLGAVLRDGDKERLWSVPIAGGPARPAVNIPAEYAIWSRDGSHLFLLRDRAVFRVNPDGTDLHKIVAVPPGSSGLRESPAPQPDVLRLTVFAKDMRSSSLWEVRLDGTGFRPILKSAEFRRDIPDIYYAGDWNSSGSYYLFRARQNGISNLWALNEKHRFVQLSESRPVQIYSTPMETRSFTPSLDGKRIYLAAAQERRESVRYDVGRRQFLPFLTDINAHHISLSDDQLRVAYTSIPEDALWTCGADGRGRVQLTVSTMRAFNPRWSPDGKFIAFDGTDGGRPTRIYVVSSSGGTLREIGSLPNEVAASWSPDGNSLLFGVWDASGKTDTVGLYIADLKSGKVERVPGSDNVFLSAWSPHARFIAAAARRTGIVLFDSLTKRWTQLVSSAAINSLFWSHDGTYIYYQELTAGAGQPIWRVRISDQRLERLMSSEQIPQANVTGYMLNGLLYDAVTHDDEPFATVSLANSDIYALDVDLPK
jgi:Tol biopolymer transport system component